MALGMRDPGSTPRRQTVSLKRIETVVPRLSPEQERTLVGLFAVLGFGFAVVVIAKAVA